jgi:endo-1,4-beta-xylanase
VPRLWLATLAFLLVAAAPASAATARRAVTVPAGSVARGVALELRAARCAAPPRVAIAVDGEVVARRTLTRRWRSHRATLALDSGRHPVTARSAACRDVQARRVRPFGLAATPPPVSPSPAPYSPPPALAALAAALAEPRALPTREVPIGTAVFWDRVRTDDGLKALFSREFDSLTPENEMKMAFLQPQQGQFAFEQADAIVRFARLRAKRVRGHTLVWHQQNPGWLTHGAWTAEELEQVLSDHVRTVVGHFRGRVDTWDVVNEPLEPDGSFRGGAAPWLRVLGPAYIETALRAARAADPDAKLFINEISAEHAGRKLDALVALAADLKMRGVPLDGIGLQNHTHVGGFPDRARLENTIQRFAALGLEVEITEMDVGTRGGGGPPDERLARQADAYRAAGEACRANPACMRITVWGMADHLSWLGADEQALPFDAALAPKPGWHALHAPFSG